MFETKFIIAGLADSRTAPKVVGLRGDRAWRPAGQDGGPLTQRNDGTARGFTPQFTRVQVVVLQSTTAVQPDRSIAPLLLTTSVPE